MSGVLGRFLEELNRRKVVSTAGVYLVGSFVAMQVVDAVFQYLPFDDPELAGRFVLLVLTGGFPVALGLAWFLEITPPQLRRERPSRDPADRRLDLASSPPKELRADSVAVLPFENLSGDPDNAYFSEGITDDIITSVAQIRGLRVLSRTSVVQYRRGSHTVEELASELGVATLVMGSVRRSGSRIRIVAEVVDARTEAHLWTETYDRELEDVFQVQSEVAARIGEAVHRELSAADRERIHTRGTSDPEAYDHYLRARFLWNQRSEASVSQSIEHFQRALALDQRFALAHSGLADAYNVLSIYGARAPREVMEAARTAADTALAIDPTLGEALAARASVIGIYDWRWPEAERAFLHALELSPSYATAHQWYAMHILAPQRRFDEARQQLRRAEELDPASMAIAISRGIIDFSEGDLAAATARFEALVTLHPTFALAHLFLGQSRAEAGDRHGSVEILARAAALAEESSETLAALGHARAVAGDIHGAEAILRQLHERAAQRYVSPALLAEVLIGEGRTEEALESLREATRQRATDLIWLGVRPMYAPLAGEPEFLEILHEVGLQGR